MSTNNNDDDDVVDVCASCGIMGGDGMKLKKCNACKLVRYCSVACQKEHRPQHKRTCKRRAAELREELLFKQPESTHLGDCPICFLPLPTDLSKSNIHSCCSKIICNGCVHAKRLLEWEESLEQKCPFCRLLCPETDVEANQLLLKRVGVNDPIAILAMGLQHSEIHNYSSAFKEFREAAGLGNMEAHYQLAKMYDTGKGVDRDEKQMTFHLEEAAIGGHPIARFNLGVDAGSMGKLDRAVKHFIIAANLGDNASTEQLKYLFRRGLVKKEDLADALRANKAAVDALKSPQREAAEPSPPGQGQMD